MASRFSRSSACPHSMTNRSSPFRKCRSGHPRDYCPSQSVYEYWGVHVDVCVECLVVWYMRVRRCFIVCISVCKAPLIISFPQHPFPSCIFSFSFLLQKCTYSTTSLPVQSQAIVCVLWGCTGASLRAWGYGRTSL